MRELAKGREREKAGETSNGELLILIFGMNLTTYAKQGPLSMQISYVLYGLRGQIKKRKSSSFLKVTNLCENEFFSSVNVKSRKLVLS